MSEAIEDENDNQDAILTPKNSMSQDGMRTPPRIRSSHSLVGEELLASSRHPSQELAINVELSPFTPSDETTPPSIRLKAKTTTSSFPNDVDLQQHSVASSYKRRNDSAGPAVRKRPPRIPQQVAPTTQNNNNNRKDTRHHRGNSHGDYSLLSALTDSSWESNSHSRHRLKRRTFSYDENERSSPGNLTTASTPVSLLQPILSEGTNLPVSIFTSPDPRKIELSQTSKEEKTSPSRSTQTTSATMSMNQSIKQVDRAPRMRSKSYDGAIHEMEHSKSKPVRYKRKKKKATTPPSSMPSQKSIQATTFNLADVMEAIPRDAEDEADIIKKIESTNRMTSDLSKCIFPAIVEDCNPLQKFDSDRKDAHSSSACVDDQSSTRTEQSKQELSTRMLSTKDSLKDLVEKLSGGSHENNLSSSTLPLRTPSRGGLDEDFFEFVRSRESNFQHCWHRIKRLSVLPSIAFAALLFCMNNQEKQSKYIFVPWRLVLFGAMQPIFWELGRLLEMILIDFLLFRRKSISTLVKSKALLHLALSKGWPFQLSTLTIMDYMILWATGRFARLSCLSATLNEGNSSWHMADSSYYTRIFLCVIALSVAAGWKRLIIGKMLGKKVVVRYRAQMEALLRKMLLISELISFAKALQGKSTGIEGSVSSQDISSIKQRRLSESSLFNTDSFEYSEPEAFEEVQTASIDDQLFSRSAEREITALLEKWEDDGCESDEAKDISIETILYFRRALVFITEDSSLANAFGIAPTRNLCIDKAQKLFEELAKKTGDDGLLKFNVLCHLARGKDKNVDQAKVKELIQLFRPSRSGSLTKLDFIKSIDSVYKSLRFLGASINTTLQIHQAYESIVDKALSVLSFFAIASVCGVDISSQLLSMGTILFSIILSIGTASSKFFEGAFFVLVQMPYDVGDRIKVTSSTLALDNSGPSGWVVEKVDLFSTTLRCGSTRKGTAIPNWQLAHAGITNLKRSDKPLIHSHLKFGVGTSKDQFTLFRDRVTDYVRARPREWSNLRSFRRTRMDQDLGYVEYVIVLQHRELWQNYISIQESKDDLFRHCLELQTAMGIRYTSLPTKLSRK